MSNKISDPLAHECALAVQRGTRLLDRAWPGWEKDISLTTLDLGSIRTCMLGQLSGTEDYGDGRANLTSALQAVRVRGLRLIPKSEDEDQHIDAEYYGFEYPSRMLSETGSSTQRAYSLLTELWTAVITRRRAKEVQEERARRGSQQN